MIKGYLKEVSLIVFSLNGKLIVLRSMSFNMIIRLWDIKTRGAWQTFKGHLKVDSFLMVSFVTFLLNGKLIVSGLNNRTVMIWDIEIRAIW